MSDAVPPRLVARVIRRRRFDIKTAASRDPRTWRGSRALLAADPEEKHAAAPPSSFAMQVSSS